MNKQFSGYETIASGYSNNMYLPHAPLDEWTLDELRRALCARANGDVLACEECENRCRYGRRIVELLKPVEMEKEEKPVSILAKSEGGKKSGAVRREKSENAYLQAIASGNPKQWFIDHGKDVRNSTYRMKQRFGNMTAEEAKARLAEKGIQVSRTQDDNPAFLDEREKLKNHIKNLETVLEGFDGQIKALEEKCGELQTANSDLYHELDMVIRERDALKAEVKECRMNAGHADVVAAVKAEMYENLYKELLQKCLARGEAK